MQKKLTNEGTAGFCRETVRLVVDSVLADGWTSVTKIQFSAFLAGLFSLIQ